MYPTCVSSKLCEFILQGVDQKILPCGQGRIDSVKINPTLLMMRECNVNSSLRHRHSLEMQRLGVGVWVGEGVV